MFVGILYSFFAYCKSTTSYACVEKLGNLCSAVDKVLSTEESNKQEYHENVNKITDAMCCWYILFLAYCKSTTSLYHVLKS